MIKQAIKEYYGEDLWDGEVHESDEMSYDRNGCHHTGYWVKRGPEPQDWWDVFYDADDSFFLAR
ncbi:MULTISPECIES: hypothetical protein [unclassified Facklamia]|uniref:hypothetical protein n=1 Tax=Aerococcaceae TaxID=186827 RepID=UPI0013B8DE41|nr:MULTISPECIES: hypothetical protein [unclassified Facklamia]NEW65302.1 hypothetical protein [Facklamia sp. 252]NEW68798.1 hypothetical protein [Facklamia sp. 253]QQD66109.1 hypothetical protein JDW14_03100 [Aerococcaceae bacterium zg-252]